MASLAGARRAKIVTHIRPGRGGRRRLRLGSPTKSGSSPPGDITFQYFIPQRTPTGSDVAMKTLGALVGGVVAVVVLGPQRA